MKRAPRHRNLRHLQPFRRRVRELLQRAERAEPSAERAAPPEQKASGGRRPENEVQRRGEKEFALEAGHQRVGEGDDVDHGELLASEKTVSRRSPTSESKTSSS